MPPTPKPSRHHHSRNKAILKPEHHQGSDFDTMTRRSYASFLASLLLLAGSIPHTGIARESTEKGSEPGDAPDAADPEQLDFYVTVYTRPVQGILTKNSEPPGIPRIYYQSPEGIRRIPTGRNTTSPLMHYRGSMPLELFDGKWVDGSPPENAPAGTPPPRQFRKKKLAALNLPESWEQAMLMVFPGMTSPDGSLRILPIRYDTAQVPPDSVRIHNTTDTSMIVGAEDETFELPAKGILDFQPANHGGHHAFRASFYSVTEKGNNRLRYSTRIVMREGERTQYLFYRFGPRRFLLHRLTGLEQLPPPEPALEEKDF